MLHIQKSVHHSADVLHLNRLLRSNPFTFFSIRSKKDFSNLTVSYVRIEEVIRSVGIVGILPSLRIIALLFALRR
jgi:hypothetical protein